MSQQDHQDLTPPTHPEGRTRFVYQEWQREPDGPLLSRPPPTGVRPPNALIWGHTLEDFFWIQRIPNIPMLTIWSRTMIKEYGENYHEEEFSEPDALQVPRLRHPWPVLKVPNDGVHVPKDSYGVIDEGCEKHSQDGYVAKRRDDSEPEPEQKALDSAEGSEKMQLDDEEVKTSETKSAEDERASEVVVDRECEPDNLSSAGHIPRDSPFSVEDLPKLEESIPHHYFPDKLVVHDPHQVTTSDSYYYDKAGRKTFPPRAPMVYRRVLSPNSPSAPSDASQPAPPERKAHLHLAHQNRIGVGNHSLVHRAPLTLPEPLSAHSRNGKVTVAVKTAFSRDSARELLANEANMYSLFPEHLSQDWCGYNLVTPIKHPVPVGPVVPRFFGYYIPIMADGTLYDATESGMPSPILLLEECGNPVVPNKFSADDR